MTFSQRLPFLSLFLLLIGPLGLAADSNDRHCRCRPHEPCWPSPDQWQALNSSIDGLLVPVRPVASACHDPDFDKAACDASMAKARDPVWRASMPGAVQWTNWEAWPERHESCFFNAPRNTSCRQGRVSLFSAVVEKPGHVQAAVRFAARFNLRLAIKNSGHCFLGRSTAPESLQISTAKLKDIQFSDGFLPKGAPKNQSDHGPAVTIGAGVHLQDLYAAAAKNNVTLVAGMAHTVAAAGGYIQGGGHSPLGPWKGMASDNALEFTVVNAKGKLLVANEYQNQDLFWALRGGGGGTFGVVISVTIRTFPNVPAVRADFAFLISPSNTSLFWQLAKDLHSLVPAISDAGGAGYYWILPTAQRLNGTEPLLLGGIFVFPNQTRADAVRRILDPLADNMRRVAGPGSQYDVSVVPRLSDWITGILAFIHQTGNDLTGANAVLGSRLISRKFFDRPDAAARLGDTMKDISDSVQGGAGFTGHVIAGGAVARSAGDSALNPAWRRTQLHVTFSAAWGSSATALQIDRIRRSVTWDGVAKLRALEPDTGAYLNEADAYEVDFQQSFWGANYKRLYDIKQKYDPHALFITRRGVGSEEWDDAGLCRVSL